VNRYEGCHRIAMCFFHTKKQLKFQPFLTLWIFLSSPCIFSTQSDLPVLLFSLIFQHGNKISFKISIFGVEFFSVKQADDENAVCNMCKRDVKRGQKSKGQKSYSTTPLHNHLKCWHKSEYDSAYSEFSKKKVEADSLQLTPYYECNFDKTIMMVIWLSMNTRFIKAPSLFA